MLRTGHTYDPSRRAFAELWARLDLQGDCAPVHRALRSAWREVQRHYHRTHHLRACLQRLQHWQQHAERPDQLALALWFHDAVYQPQASDNEARSAQWAATELQQAQAHPTVVQRITTLIMATAHAATNTVADAVPDPDRELLIDIDLAILGAAPQHYQRYTRQVRREYAWLDDDAWRKGRSAVLQHFLQQPRIYASPPGQALEQAARANLLAELERLRR